MQENLPPAEFPLWPPKENQKILKQTASGGFSFVFPKENHQHLEILPPPADFPFVFP